MIVVVDYGAANLLSIRRALTACGAEVEVTSDPEVVAAAAGVVLPGVGAAGAAMGRLRESGVGAALWEVARARRPLLGLCLGMQLCFEWLEEDQVAGLGILPGEVRLLPPGHKIPHMGWNTLTWNPDARASVLFAGLDPGVYAYFVHSYRCLPADSTLTIAWTEYGNRPICAAVTSGRVTGFQFHPEKSGVVGLTILTNWLKQVGAAEINPNLVKAEVSRWQ